MTESGLQTKPESNAQKSDFWRPSKVAGTLLVICFLSLLIGIFNAASPSGGGSDDSDVAPTKVDSSVSSLFKKDTELELVTVEGPIYMTSPQEQNNIFQMDTNAMSARKALDYAADHDNIKGVLLRINSPGGTVGMSQELHDAVKRVSAKKPVVVSMGDLCASGGFYTASAADKLIANPGTLTASIGVILSSTNLTDLFNTKLGIHQVTVKSGKYKDILSPYRKPTSDELALLQNLIDDSYHDFLGAVIDGRTRYITDPKQKEEVTKQITAIADGRVVDGNQALKAGLIDDVGDWDHAYTVLDQMAKDRFHLKNKKRLPLVESPVDSISLLSLLGIGNHLFTSPPQASAGAGPLDSYIPFSMRYPNQPLWIVE